MNTASKHNKKQRKPREVSNTMNLAKGLLSWMVGSVGQKDAPQVPVFVSKDTRSLHKTKTGIRRRRRAHS
jgi:hypothetical protein